MVAETCTSAFMFKNLRNFLVKNCLYVTIARNMCSITSCRLERWRELSCSYTEKRLQT